MISLFPFVNYNIRKLSDVGGTKGGNTKNNSNSPSNSNTNTNSNSNNPNTNNDNSAKPPEQPQPATQTTTTQLPDNVFRTMPDDAGKNLGRIASFKSFCSVNVLIACQLLFCYRTFTRHMACFFAVPHTTTRRDLIVLMWLSFCLILC